MTTTKRRTKQEAFETHVAILEAIAAGDTLLDIRVRMGVSQNALNGDIIWLKRAGYLAGDARSAGLRVVRLPDAPIAPVKKSVGKRTTRANASREQRRALEANGDAAGDVDVYYVLKELADPNGLRMTALFPPEWVSKAQKQGYVRDVGDGTLMLTFSGRAALPAAGDAPALSPPAPVTAPPASPPVQASNGRSGDADRARLIRHAARLAQELAAALRELERVTE